MLNQHLRHLLGRSNRRPDALAPESDGFPTSNWQEQIPVGTVDVLLPLFGATAPAELLPECQPPRGFFEPLSGLAMREMFETAVFTNLFGPRACPETLGLWR